MVKKIINETVHGNRKTVEAVIEHDGKFLHVFLSMTKDADVLQEFTSRHDELVNAKSIDDDDKVIDRFSTIGYAEARRLCYPSIGEQLDMMYWDEENNTKLWKEKIKEIKTLFPKS